MYLAFIDSSLMTDAMISQLEFLFCLNCGQVWGLDYVSYNDQLFGIRNIFNCIEIRKNRWNYWFVSWFMYYFSSLSSQMKVISNFNVKTLFFTVLTWRSPGILLLNKQLSCVFTSLSHFCLSSETISPILTTKHSFLY